MVQFQVQNQLLTLLWGGQLQKVVHLPLRVFLEVQNMVRHPGQVHPPQLAPIAREPLVRVTSRNSSPTGDEFHRAFFFHPIKIDQLSLGILVRRNVNSKGFLSHQSGGSPQFPNSITVSSPLRVQS